MKKDFKELRWETYLVNPIYEAFPEYENFYKIAWELAHQHVKEIDGMPQNPYMDEAFCDTQIWIWDTCFMSLFCKFAQEVYPGIETFQNFYEVLYNNGTLPSVIPTELEPTWTRAIPGEPFHIQVHMADNPPLFAWAEYENALIHGDKAYLKELLYEKRILQRHYEYLESLQEGKYLPNVFRRTFWMAEKFGYKWEGGSSGMDNTPRGRVGARAEKERPNNPTMLWIDAICQQALSAKSIAEMFAILGDGAQANVWGGKYNEKKKIVNEYYWNKEDKFYYDIDCISHLPYKVPTIASYWTLTAGIANQEQARQMLEYLQKEDMFGGEVPFVSLARKDADFVPQGQYWRGGVWLPTAYATLKGLTNYGYHKEARELANKLLSHMWKTYQEYEPHTIWECYAPDFCAPGTQTDNYTIVRPDFCGWSALGPISIFIEYVLGFHTINAFENRVVWEKPSDIKGKIGIKNLRFGDVVTDIVAEGATCSVSTTLPYTLVINGKAFSIPKGNTTIALV